MSQYLGRRQHGYWWLHANGTLRCSGKQRPEITWFCIGTWNVRCKLDWYRMMKEYKVLVEGPIEPLVA